MSDNTVPAALAEAVASEMGDGWTRDRQFDGFGAVVMHSDGRRLIMRGARKRMGMLAVSVIYPQIAHDVYYFRSDNGPREINVSIDRGAAQIAREITRRLLPAYTATFAEAMAAVHEARTNLAARRAVAAEVYALIGKTPPGPPEDEWRRADSERQALKSGSLEVNLYGVAGGYGSVEINCDGSSGSLRIRSIPMRKIMAALELLVSGTE